jgi:hypothetical protein
VTYSFVRKLKEYSADVFRLINQWCEKLTTEGSEELELVDANSLNRVKQAMVEAFYAWVLIDIKKEQFVIIGQECQSLICVLFEQISNENDSFSTASNCIGEILVICKKMGDDKLKDFIKQNLLLLRGKFSQL